MNIRLPLFLALLLSAVTCLADDLHREEGFKLVNGVDHFYRIVGDGEPFVVLHGGPGMYHDELYPFFDEFAASRRVIFYDQRGNGLSQLATVDSTTFTVELLVEDLEQLRRAFGIEQLNITGHSWGGLLAMYYAVEHPENVKRLILVSSAPVNTELLIKCYERQIGMYTPEQWAHLQKLWESDAYRAGDPAVHNEALRLAEGVLFHDPAKVDPWMAAAAFDAAKAANAVRLEDLGRGMKLGIHVQDRLDRITCPTLIVHCRDDFIVPEAPQLAHELIAGSQMVVLENSGHYPHVEIPGPFFAAVERFIAETR